jgi:methylthioribose-1-phosphate isomerase
MAIETIRWEHERVCLIDQTRLPHVQEYVCCATVAAVAEAIRGMVVRGAPAIGVTAAYGMALAARNSSGSTPQELLADLRRDKAILNAARPTAVNLHWATERVLRRAEVVSGDGLAAVRTATLEEARAIYAEDLAMCHAIGEHGATLLDDGARVLTHCNAGGLATAGYGTALAPIRTAHTQGKRLHILVDETRPFLQGARLTAWELQEAGIPQTLITDNMAGYFMGRGEVDCVIVGADRIVANGDTANKIGTYSVAVLARAHGIPFFVAAPSSTIDFSIPDGSGIPIEQRDAREVTHLFGQPLAPEGVSAAHPAFDVTPHTLINAIITEKGVIRPPYVENLSELLNIRDLPLRPRP